jgi:hypothetical protein
VLLRGPPASALLRQMPADDAEAVAQRGTEGFGVQAPVEAARFADCRAGFTRAALSPILRIAHIRMD